MVSCISGQIRLATFRYYFFIAVSILTMPLLFTPDDRDRHLEFSGVIKSLFKRTIIDTDKQYPCFI